MKNFSLGIKMAFGFAIIMVFLCIVAFIGFNSMSGVVDRSSKADGVAELVTSTLSIRQNEKNYIMRNDEAFVAKVDEGIKEVISKAGAIKDSFKQTVNKDQMDQVTDRIRSYAAAFHEYVGLRQKKALAMTTMREKAGIALNLIEKIRMEQKAQFEEVRKTSDEAMMDKLKKADDANRMIKWFLDCRKNEKEYIISGDMKFLDTANKHIKNIYDLSQDLKSRFTKQKNISDLNELQKELNGYNLALNSYVEMTNLQQKAEQSMLETARAAMKVCAAARTDQKSKMESEISTANMMIWIGTAIAIVCGIFFAVLITRSITKPVNRIIAGLNEGSSQVAAASGEVSSSSQAMASGATQQAASIEEISSSMEEMASMTKRNAENSSSVDRLMKDANTVVNEANASMGHLTQSMEDISKASEETSKIIKTIDEIAFQTNLLALNAAVEAARAGEAGAGFAVVADEVRNLAIRAAEAAKNTAALIEGTVKKVNDGSELVASTNEAFTKVAESTAKVGELVSDISTSSSEQSNGIEQINSAISEMDNVVQQNAASAEESAAAAEEMSAQAEQLKEYVDDLVMLVTGKIKQKGRSFHDIKPLARGGAKGKKLITSPAQSKAIRPNQVMAFDGDDTDFRDF
nr:methyl-accepting chemotaxis protein [uncultured Desulfobacter sp.]